MAKKWAAHRHNLWSRFYDPSKIKDEIIANVAAGVDPTQWAHYVNYRLKRETQEQIEVGLAQSSVDESVISPDDVVGRVLGPEHNGRVRCMGMAAAP
ncbi:hypothetical protein A2U01_0046787, partial [Trifolium medium]|nr:hypothetical protein [Trifolium medium]